MVNRLLGLTMGAAALSLSVLVAAPTASKQKLEKVDLSQMKDGETRTLGQGDHVITATRRGDVVTVKFGDEDGEKRNLKCNIDKDSCYAMTTSGDGAEKVIVVNKSGKAGKDFSPVIVHSGNDDEGNFVFATTEGGEGAEIIVDAVGDGMSWVSSDGEGLLPGMRMLHKGEGGTLLQCPEGDATLTLKKGEESSGPYFCPKHNLRMEKSTAHTFVKKIVISDEKEE